MAPNVVQARPSAHSPPEPMHKSDARLHGYEACAHPTGWQTFPNGSVSDATLNDEQSPEQHSAPLEHSSPGSLHTWASAAAPPASVPASRVPVSRPPVRVATPPHAR